MRLRVLWPGKTRKSYYREAVADYAERIAKLVSFEIVEIREDARSDKMKSIRVRKESEALSAQRRAAVTVVLDSAGKQFSSEQFAAWLNSVTGDVDFILGGPQGVDIPEVSMKWSLGNLTLPHELARVVLLEQIYRAMTILKRIPYHK